MDISYGISISGKSGHMHAPGQFTAVKCKLSPVRSIGDNDFLRVISWACWYYHPLLVLVNYLLCYVAIYIC